MNTQDASKEEKKLPSNAHDVSSVLSQSMIPISMMLSEAAKVDVLITIGRLLMTPALVMTTIVVLASLPIARAWDHYHAQPGQSAPSDKPAQEAETNPHVNNSNHEKGQNPTPSSGASILTGPVERKVPVTAPHPWRRP